MSPSQPTHSDWLILAEWDWVDADENEYLHAVEQIDDPATVEEDWGGPGVTVCGLRAAWLSIPGVFSRLGAERCPECSRLLSMPAGIGSPKNDKACRPLVEMRIGSLTTGPGRR